MPIQVRIDSDKAPPEVVKKYLGKKQRKRLARDGHVVVRLRLSSQEALRAKKELGASYVS